MLFVVKGWLGFFYCLRSVVRCLRERQCCLSMVVFVEEGSLPDFMRNILVLQIACTVRND